jgi:hypothetical protein
MPADEATGIPVLRADLPILSSTDIPRYLEIRRLSLIPGCNKFALRRSIEYEFLKIEFFSKTHSPPVACNVPASSFWSR